MSAVLSLVGGGDNAFGRGDPVELAPSVTRLDPIYAPSPRVIRDMHGRRKLGGFAEREYVRRRPLTQLPKARLYLTEQLSWQPPPEARAGARVRGVLLRTRGVHQRSLRHRGS